MRLLFILPFAAVLCLSPPALAQAPQPAGDWQVCFTPEEECTQKLVGTLRQARRSILVQAYSFTSAPIARALVDARRRGVEVEVILDHSQQTEKYSSADYLSRSGIPTLIDAEHAIAHNKVMIIDEETVVTGSFNFTRAAQQHNAENLLIIRDAALAQRYFANWRLHREHSQPYQRSRNSR